MLRWNICSWTQNYTAFLNLFKYLVLLNWTGCHSTSAIIFLRFTTTFENNWYKFKIAYHYYALAKHIKYYQNYCLTLNWKLTIETLIVLFYAIFNISKTYSFNDSSVNIYVVFKAFLQSSLSTQPAGMTKRFPSGENCSLRK